MRKVFLIIICIFMLSGCNKINKEAERTPESTPESTPDRVNVETQKEDEVIGSFITNILDTDPDRVKNLTLCANTLNGVSIEPGQVFSFNGTVGQRTSQKGYEEAKILVENESEYAVGGGVCQISSTLYNAAMDAGMEIVERHSHSKPIHYVATGKDAAISWGTLDLKFKNVLSYPVELRMKVTQGQVMAEIIK